MTNTELQDIFRKPYACGQWQNLLIKLFGATKLRVSPAELNSNNNKAIKGEQLGELNTSDFYSVGLFAFEVGEGTRIEMNRVGLRQLVRSYTRYEYDAAITVYYNKTHWRLSLICDLKGENTAPKRYTYVFGNNAESYRTAADRLIKLCDTKPSFESIKEAFSVERLSKEFFGAYKKQYEKFVKHIGDTKPNRDYVKKMLGRLVFLQFLQKKGWMGVSVANCAWNGGDLQYTQNLVKQYQGNNKLISEVLEVLFFDTLNTKRNGDVANSILGENIKIPYLNGGLFDRDELDKKDIDFPYSYFVDLMEFFSAYNFTFDENDPYDAEIGIDPEMLGHIFENLLEDNKDKGAFYTPKEIVQYMCRQSLIEYLGAKLGKNVAVAEFINTHTVGDSSDAQNFVLNNANEINRLLDVVKICDPAIGSGAFPMGILNEIFYAKLALNASINRAETKKNIIQNSIYGVDIEQGAVDIARLRFWLSLVVDETEPQPLPNLDYKIMCGNSLLSRYALDVPIQHVFAQYNLENTTQFSLSDYKALVANYTNTTSSADKDAFRSKIESIKRAFKTEMAKTDIKNRQKLEAKIQQLRSPKLFSEPTKADLAEAKRLEKTLKAKLQNEADTLNNKLYENAFEWRFEFPALLNDDGEFMGFDVVIGNPPYIQLQANGGALAEQLKCANYETYARTGDIYCLFYERGLQLLANGGIETYITSNKWMRAGYGEKTRAYFAKHNPLTLVDLGAGVFDSATVDTNILIVQKIHNANELQAATIAKCNFSAMELMPTSINNGDIWTILSPIEQSIKNKIEAIGVPLREWDVEINYGIKTGYNEAFIISTEKRNEILSLCETEDERARTEEIIKPILRGRDIKRYVAQWAGLWLIGTFPALKLDIDNYPALHDYLLTFGKRLHQTGGVGCRKKTNNKWFETQDTIAYYADFDKEKIIYREISTEMDALYSTDSVTVNNKCYIMTGESLKYLICILNSKAFNFYLNKQVSTTGGKGCDFFDNISIPKLPKAAQLHFIDIVDEIIAAKVLNADTNKLEKRIDKMVYEMYGLSEEEIGIVEAN